MKMKKHYQLILILLAIVSILLAFYIGQKYARDEIWYCAYSPMFYKTLDRYPDRTYLQILADCTGKSLTKK